MRRRPVDEATRPPLRFDALLLSQARLGIVSVLVSRPEATFTDLKELLGLTPGNLGVHLQKLEDAGYVKVTKEFVRRKPRTTCAISSQGRAAFLKHLEQLQTVVQKGRGG